MLRLLSDECFEGKVVRGLRRLRPDLELVRVQDVGLQGMKDPDVLVPMITAALGNRALVDVPPEQLGSAVEAAVRFVLRAVGAGEIPVPEPDLG